MSDVIESGWFDASFVPPKHLPHYRRFTIEHTITSTAFEPEGGYPMVEGLQPGGIWTYVVNPNGDICTRCGDRSSHTIWTKDGITVHRCCRCYVAEGNEPERFRRGCTKALSEIRGQGMCPPVRAR